MENPFPYHKHQLLEKGFQFLQHQFLPALIKSEDNLYIAESFAELMHLCYQLQTPNTAISFGEKAIQKGIDHPIFFELYITLHLEIGDYLKALKEIKKAINVYPDHLPLHHLQQQIQDYMNYDHEPKFDQDNWFWRMNEHLINREFVEISKGLKRIDTDLMESHLLQLRVYGGRSEAEALRIGISQFKESFPGIEFSAVDEFYFS
jgi:tetratricopeptide (TPR) repeat protein